MRGRKPKPLEQQIAEGDTRKSGKRRLSEHLQRQPKGARGFPPCPEHLQGPARETWAFLTEELAEMGLDCRADALLLQGACVFYERAIQIDELLAKTPVTAENIPERRKLIISSREAWALFRGFCSDFGLSPVSRMRLTIEKPDDGMDELMELLNKPRTRKEIQ